jgi:glycosyltransferase involved in cell wall biosynthesis
VKVSIVVPTYAPGDRINRLVHSLEAQTMPSSDFEVIFVDDGSPDQTWQQLERIRDTHDNVRIEWIENSGWPSRPRNVGLEMARGEYVLFMDHDDELYPRALEAGYALAAQSQADVLNGKETRTDQSKWAIDTYTQNMANAIDREDVHPLIPTNPHKLFRRALLMQHGIRFPEGGRVLWEDVFFALDIAPHLKVVSVLADTPFYHWVRGAKTASSSFAKDLTDYWHWLREIILRTNERLGGPGLERQWRLMLLHQYRSRVLAAIGKDLFRADKGDLDFVRKQVDDIVCNHIPAELDAYLTPTQLGRAVLVRSGRWDLLPKLAAIDSGLVGISTASSIRWVDGTLRMAVTSHWTTSGQARLAIRADGDRIVRDLPSDVAAALPDAAIDMGAPLQAARTSLGIRARDTGITWMLPGTSESQIETIDGRPELVVTGAATLDPSTAIFGRPLDETSWDVTARNEVVGTINQRGLRTSLPARTAVKDGHIYIAYRNASGMLSLDVDERNRSLAGSARLDPSRARSTTGQPTGSRWPFGRKTHFARFELPFAGVATSDETVLDGKLRVGDGLPLPARITARRDGVWLESSVEQRPGNYPMTLSFGSRDIDSRLELSLGPHGELTFRRVEK